MVLKRRSLQPPVMHPRRRQDITQHNVGTLFNSKDFQNEVAHRLSGAVQIPTIAYDGMDPVGEDPRWDIFYQFSDYLERTFPKVYKALTVETVSTHALLYTWQGWDETLKPMLLMAHSDVVPAGQSATSEWSYPPFSGYYDGEFIWGRGSEDDKSNLIAMLTAVDCLLACDFKPQRTLIVSVGFDEEGGADQSYGARCLADTLLARYGKDSMELIFDEGIAGIEKRFGTDFALPATAEKGYVDVTIKVSVPGGHSSTPPDHTAIGFLAQTIRLIEDHPFPSQLIRHNPTLIYLRQAALLSKNMPDDLREAILGSQSSRKLLEYLDNDRERRAMVRTSTAIDVVQGGDKVNSLPENATVLVNHRIAIQDSVHVVKDHYVSLLSPWARRWNFNLNAFGARMHKNHEDGATRTDGTNDCGDLTLVASYELDPSPVSDTDDACFRWLSGTIRGVFGENVVVAPELLSGNTDTRYYWDLSPQIYRMSPWRASHDPRGTRMHTVDERMPVAGLLEMVKFYHEFIRVMDEVRR
ncbi:Gly-Xaa carboxypeptidase [Exophiala oligosperma]